MHFKWDVSRSKFVSFDLITRTKTIVEMVYNCLLFCHKAYICDYSMINLNTTFSLLCRSHQKKETLKMIYCCPIRTLGNIVMTSLCCVFIQNLTGTLLKSFNRKLKSFNKVYNTLRQCIYQYPNNWKQTECPMLFRGCFLLASRIGLSVVQLNLKGFHAKYITTYGWFRLLTTQVNNNIMWRWLKEIQGSSKSSM